MTDTISSGLSPRMKMADLVNASPELLVTMTRFGIAPGFGESTVEECCIRTGKDSFTFLTICRIALDPGWKPGADELSGLRVRDLTDFLRSSHDSYKDVWLPYMEKQIEATLAARPESQRKVISEFFGKFKLELEKHFALEEKKIFPSLEAMEGGRPRSFRHEHGEIGEKIQDLISLLLKYLPASGSMYDITNLLSQFYFLRHDLAVHSRIEDSLVTALLSSGK